MRKIQVLRHALRVINIIQRAATVLRRAFALQFRQPPLIPQLHRQTNDRVPLLQKHGRHGRRIHAAGHSYSHKPELWFSRSGQGIKLDLHVHSHSILA